MGKKTEATLLLTIKQKGKDVLKSLKQGLTDLTGVATGIAGVFTAVGAAGIAAADKLGKFEGVKRSFESLAASQGQQADKMLASMKELSQGTVSEMKLMEQANQALLLSLPVDRFGDMLKIAQSSAAATGQSMDFMLNSIVTGLGHGSKLMLDNLGIVFKSEDAYNEYAKSLGKAASELTEAEKKQAFINKALAVGMDNAKKAGAANLTLSQRIDRLSAGLQDGLMTALQIAKPALEFFITKIEDMFAAAKTGTDEDALSVFFENTAKAATIAMAMIKTVASVIQQMVMGISRTLGNLMSGKFTGATRPLVDAWNNAGQTITSNFEETAKDLNDIEDRFAQARVERIAQEVEQKREIRVQEAEEKKEFDQAGWEEAQALEMERKQLEMDQLGADEAQKLAIRQKALDLQLKQEKDNDKRRAIWQEKLKVQDQQAKLAQQKEEEKRQELMLQGFGQFFGGLAALAQSGNKRVAAIGRAAAIAKATIDAYVAINTTMASLPFPANVAAAAGIGVQAFANVAQIAGVKFAEGGIVPATSGGMSAIIGEAGRSEAVIPLPDDFDPEDGGGLGGGSNVFNFYGPILGNETQAREYAIMLDEELYKLRKSNESVAFDEGVS